MCDHYHIITLLLDACVELKIMRLHLIQLSKLFFNLRPNFGIILMFASIIKDRLLLRFQKLLRDMTKLLETNGSTIWSPADVQHLDRALGELKRSFTSQVIIA